MTYIFIYSAVVFAISWVIGLAHISFPIRDRLQKAGFHWTVTLLECVGCTGVWLGLLAFFLGRAPAELSTWWIAAGFTATTNLVLLRLAGLDRP